MTDMTASLGERVARLETAMNNSERLAAVEAILPHLATKADLQSVKVWVLSAVLGAVVSAIAAVATMFIALSRIL